jgi:hypothetical protein
MKVNSKPVLHALLFAGLLAGAAAAAPAASAASGPAHDHGHASAAQVLRLNDGRKWEGDDPLRQSMTKIRDAVGAVLPAVHRGKLKASQYDALGDEIDRQVANIVQNCKLDPLADEVLHAILADLMAGNEALRGHGARTSRGDGVLGVVDSLEQYGKYFEHPGWKPLPSDH